jgi:hypothetical protein
MNSRVLGSTKLVDAKHTKDDFALLLDVAQLVGMGCDVAKADKRCQQRWQDKWNTHGYFSDR